MRFRIKDLGNYLSTKKKLNWQKLIQILTINSVETSLEDGVLELDILPNRAPDLNSFLGLAKEIAIFSQAKFNEPKILSIRKTTKRSQLVKNQIQNLVPFYFGAILDNLQIKPSPEWLQELISFYNLQPQNILVDLANFVMLEFNAPMHIFDLDKIEGKIFIRFAKKGEQFIDLRGEKYTLDSKMIVIADEKDVLALAGIIGGQKAKVTSETKRVFIEAAVFDHYLIRKTMQRLNLTTEAGLRFAKKVVPIRTFLALHRLIDLLQEFANGQLKVKVMIGKLPEKKEILFIPKNFSQLTGIELSDKQIKDILQKIGCEVKGIQSFKVKLPLDRLDLTTEVDLIEEVLRIYSYTRIPKVMEYFSLVDENREWSREEEIINLLLRLGFQETFSYSFPLRKYLFQKDNLIFAQNPISEERPAYRNSLLPSLLEVIYELQFQQKQGKIFQIGEVAFWNNNTIVEKRKIGLAVFGQNEEHVFQQLIDGVKMLCTHFSLQCAFKSIVDQFFGDGGAKIVFHNQEIGVVGMLLPKISKKLDFDVFIGLAEIDLQPFLRKQKSKFIPYPETPSSYRDLSFWIDPKITFTEVEKTIKNLKIKTLESFSLIDIYHENDKKSFTIRFIFRHPSKNLTGEEVEELFSKIQNTLEKKFQIKVR